MRWWRAMNKAKKRFVRYAMLSILVLLTVLLGIINVVSFSMAGDEADKLTERLAEGRGRFTQQVQPPKNGFNMQDGRPPVMGPTGPDSPEMSDSLRYFCFAFGEDDGS